MKLPSVFEIFKPAPFIEEIKNPEEVKKQFQYWRMRTFYSIYVGYVFYYFTRKSFTFVMPALMDDLGFSMTDLGILGSILYVTYGISKFASGVLSDRANPRYFMAFGLILTGVFNICFGLSSSIYLFAFFWGLNGIFQGWGWPPCTKQLTYWFSKSERGFWWSLKSTSHNVGGALIPLLVAYCSQIYGWRVSMYVPALMSILAGLWLLERLRDVPQSLGLPSVEKFKGEESTEEGDFQTSVDTSPPSVRDILFKHVLANKAVWLLACSYFFVYVIRTAINDWGALYLVKQKGYSMVSAATGVTWFEVGGFLGILAAGWGSDYFFQGRRLPIMIFSALGLLLILPFFWHLPQGFLFLDFLSMAILGFLIFGPQMLVGLAAAEFVDKKAACTANGFAGCFAYIGAAATGYPLGYVLDHWGWSGFFVTLMVCSVVMILSLAPMLLLRPSRKLNCEVTSG